MSWRPSDGIEYPHGQEHEEENVLYGNGRVQQVNGREDYLRYFPPKP
jgi:hypothetical protein